jgi:ATP-dependent exoDNAse (exonuclease V) beta subunit
MTLHKAKGLEFDWVIIPSLARGARSDDRSLLLWDESVSPEGERGFLLAADDHSDTGSPTLYNYLKLQRREKARLENTRLLYVGATRAISRLFLSACLATEGGAEKGEPDKVKPPPEGALLHSIWPAFRSQMRLNPPVAAVVAKTEVAPPLWRAASLPAAPPANGELATAPNRPEEPQNRVERIVGTVIHECLEHIAASPKLVQTLSPDRRAQLHLRLRELGLWGHALATAAERVERDVERTLSDEQGGRWILDPGHREARSEMPLTVLGDGKVHDIVIDRSFVDRDSGIRWIIDYKSSLPAPGVDEAVFTAGEAERYRTQLRGYRDAMRALGTEPVRCALYFTGLALLYPLRELDD